MGTPSVPRRNVLKLGAAMLTYGLFTMTSRISDDDPPPALAQVSTMSQDAGSLTGGVWLWQRTDYADGTTVVCSDPSTYTITFLATGLFTFQADCNQGNGTYTVAGSQLTLQPGAMTRAACPPGSQDTVFVQDLGRVATYTFDAENLVFNLQLDSGNMVFSLQPPLSLTDSVWQVQSVNNGKGGVVTVLPETSLDATFNENGIVGGNTGCNTYRGLYVAADGTIAFSPLITTRRACLSDEAAAQEQAFLVALGASTRYELRGNRLTLRNDAGATQVNLVRLTVVGTAR